MRLSTKGRFAVTAMIDVALRGGFGPVALTETTQCAQFGFCVGSDFKDNVRLRPKAAAFAGIA